MEAPYLIRILQSITLESLSKLSYDKPLDTTDELVSSLVNTCNAKLTKFNLTFSGDTPTVTLKKILQGPHKHLK